MWFLQHACVLRVLRFILAVVCPVPGGLTFLFRAGVSMPSNPVVQFAASAWYEAPRVRFLEQTADAVSAHLLQTATRAGWMVEQAQEEEWAREVSLLKRGMQGRRQPELAALESALAAPGVEEIEHVVLEYDLRRRGLRIDAVLLAPGVIVVLEFKRSAVGAASLDQVTHYAANLLEFHEETRALCGEGMVLVPIVVRTRGEAATDLAAQAGWWHAPFSPIWARPLTCDADGLPDALRTALALRKATTPIEPTRWVQSRFAPSSTILDAAISLYGQHEVSAIREHASPVEEIRACTAEVAERVQRSLEGGERIVVLVSGAPGAGKTLVALNLAFDPRFREEAVFVTGNAPLVEVLQEALEQSYRASRRAHEAVVASGYAREDARETIRNSTFKIVKAHRFLGERGRNTASSDGRVVLFDEAQRTYEKGRRVLGQPLADHEADLILQALEHSYRDGLAVVAMLGQNQAINTGERGAIAWFEAAQRRGWRIVVSDETLHLPELAEDNRWADHPSRDRLERGHLGHSMRFYRNAGLERWVHHLLEDEPGEAARIAATLDAEGHTVWVTRDLERARQWIRSRRMGEERAGIIASSQARRLAAHGLHVDHKPRIADWMLKPTGDPRSGNMLESVQNQYQIQGLELDWSLVAWGADLRRETKGWSAYRLRGANWTNDNALDVAKNTYRVLLTRARKGMVVFVSLGDRTGVDPTRPPEWFDAIHTWLLRSGARSLD
ncbi:MAG: DUF2075 domain-containing protein [Deltaproteobacteria bacterium]|nr:MAG: DUF2075 domain-containing protein [Deltaproteobacteria bacterium]